MRTTLAFFLSTLPISGAAASDTKQLVIYTYESFTAEWGPGPKVEKTFEAKCGCDIKFVSVADGVAILNRLRLEGDRAEADIVLGLDTSLTHEAKATGLFTPHGIDISALTVPGGYTDLVFVPFDYAHFAVIYDSEKVKAPPTSLKQLVEGSKDQRIVIQDPRTSTPGLGLLLWMKAVYGDKAADAWRQLSPRILTVTPGWSEAYGLFTKGEAEMVLSYTTSPVYHAIVEASDRYRAAAFSEGHYLQVEVAAQTKKGAANPLAKQFLEFMISPAFQDIIPENNWMLPVGELSAPLNAAFDNLVRPEKTLMIDAAEVAANRAAWTDEWQAALGR